MGIRIPRVTLQAEPVDVRFGVGGTSASGDLAMRRFVELLPLLAELVELENAVLRLARASENSTPLQRVIEDCYPRLPGKH